MLDVEVSPPFGQGALGADTYKSNLVFHDGCRRGDFD